MILDTGPLVALLNQRDQWHEWSRDQFARLNAPLLTCEPVITEAAHLLGHSGGSDLLVPELIVRGFLKVDFELQAQSAAVAKLLKKYHDLPMDLADACLVRMSETIDDSVILTLDSDFDVYRRNGRQTIPLITPR